jgi:hypothetical protein
LTFSESQIYLARWLASDKYPSDPSQCESLQLGKQKENDYQRQSPFGCTVFGDGHIMHPAKSMISIGSGLFNECIEEAQHLRENPNNLEAQVAFTQAIKKFVYTWSQSTTYLRGQAAVLTILVDSIAKYAGFKLKRPEVPEEVRTTLRQLTERFPDKTPKVEGSETETGYTVQLNINGKDDEFNRKNDEKWLQDFFFHYDVFALHMPSFRRFDERYKLKLVPINPNEAPTISN